MADTARITSADLADWLADLVAFNADHPVGWSLAGCPCVDHDARLAALMERKAALLDRCAEAMA